MVIYLDIILGCLLYLLSGVYMVSISTLSRLHPQQIQRTQSQTFNILHFIQLTTACFSTTSIQIHDYDNLLVTELWEVA